MKSIVITREDIEKWTPVLKKYFSGKSSGDLQNIFNKYNVEDIDELLDKIFAECQTGWNRAPYNLDTRIKIKTGFQWRSHENLRPREKKQETEQEVKEEENVFNTMSDKEKEWWGNRKMEYLDDFDFNKSSDIPLLDQLLLEELLQRRIFYKQLKNKDHDYNKQLNDGLKRIADIQTKLGITREQRAGVLNKIDGNIAQISVELNEKLAKMSDELKKEYEEEMKYLSIRNQREPANILPPLAKIEALLGGEKASANIDSTKMSEITEAVGKEISDKREEKPQIKELADGVEV